MTDHASGIRLLHCSELVIIWKSDNDVTIFGYDVSSNFLKNFLFVLFSYWSQFHVNAITGSRVVKISFYKRLTRNPEIGNIPV